MAKAEQTEQRVVEGFEPEQWLIDAGFVYDYDKHTEGIQTAQDVGMNSGGDFKLQGIYVRGAVTVEIQQNTDTQARDGLEMMIKHPAVAVIEGPKGRVSANPVDREFILRLAGELA